MHSNDGKIIYDFLMRFETGLELYGPVREIPNASTLLIVGYDHQPDLTVVREADPATTSPALLQLRSTLEIQSTSGGDTTERKIGFLDDSGDICVFNVDDLCM
jgi:hypothetical protein